MNDSNNAQIRMDSDPLVRIPGIADLVGKSEIPPSLLLLTGPAGVGKSMYCRQFFLDSIIQEGCYCIYVSASMPDKQFKSILSRREHPELIHNSKFINPYLNTSDNTDSDKLSSVLVQVHELLAKQRDPSSQKENELVSSKVKGDKPIRVVIDSLTHFFVLFGEGAVLKFVTELAFLLKEYEVTGIFALTNNYPSADQMINILSSTLDGILEMRMEEDRSDGSLTRSIRMHSMKGMHHNPTWVQFKIADDGNLVFGDQSTVSLNCTMCGKPILGKPIMDMEFAFDSPACIETYRKLAGVYGSSISDTGLPSQVVNVNFFFIDIVGLSNPSLSVKKQIEKIEVLNNLIGSCDAFARAKERKIVLPTGDGMAIGFFMNPESPLQLSIQLHSKLQTYNRGKNSDEGALGVRIGLSSGPVFIVNDMNNNQNVWGPGIILARRVMDIGDNLHILLSSDLAETLMAIKDEYKKIIKPIGDYQIKHGQIIKLYSAFSTNLGNPKLPLKLLSHHQAG